MIYWFLYIFVYFSFILPYYAVKKVYAVWFFFCNFVAALNNAYKMLCRLWHAFLGAPAVCAAMQAESVPCRKGCQWSVPGV